jgi:Flp pilus assembly protein TadG
MRLHRSIQRFRRDERGVSLVFAAFAITGIMLATGISIDFARYYIAKARLQANVQQAALAGATNFYPYASTASANTTQVTNTVNAVLTANQMPGLMTTDAASISFRCSSTLSANPLNYVSMKTATSSCVNTNSANVVRVTQTATVKLYFGRFLHSSSLGIWAGSEAVPSGGVTSNSTQKPVNLAIIVDTTNSMGNTDNSCKDGKGNTLSRLNCVKMGLSYLFNGLAGTNTKLQLLTFPPIDSTTNGGNVGVDSCSASGSVNITNFYGTYTPGTSAAGKGPYGSINEQYTVLPVVSNGGPPVAVLTNSNSFMASNGTMATSSPFYKALGAYADGTGKPITPTPTCTGLQNPGGIKTYYGDALAWARNNLSLNNDGNWQDVIVLLSDGQANSPNLPTSSTTPPNTPFSANSITNIVSNLTLNGVNATDLGIKNTTTTFTTPGTNAFPGSSGQCASSVYCGKTTNTYVTYTSGAFKNECKAAAQYAQQLQEFNPTVNGKSLGTPKIYSYYYGDGSGTNGCTTETDSTYTSCSTMQKIATNTTQYFFSADSTCVGQNGKVVDISAAFGQLVYDIMGNNGRARTIPYNL